MLLQWCKGYALDKKRRSQGAEIGLRKPPNMVFLGNPGTGKTKVARMLAHILHNIGAIRHAKVVEVQRTDLVGCYVGRTGIKTRAQLRKAEGGILFVDEAYRLLTAEDNTSDYGREALDEILSQMDSKDLVVIFAGYTVPMKKVLDCNEGFRRRVGRIIEFPDYTPLQIVDIMNAKLAEERTCLQGFKLAPDCTRDAVAALIESGIPAEERSKRNGGLAGTLPEYAREHLDGRLSAETDDFDELMTIGMKDLEAAVSQVASCAKF
ncbi:AAA+-type ATPase [Klebsormidium nitens]|uniref:AAA+-type ATPase n=1 Tax=Klebsormidium nitens TaxID=105231 RepID=A0A1Y1IFB5_KLENI|nr:AAA+-type ATPase [Klebsormidium nitens]|eukprot:GAQ89313.1 AAA+-type ATPase [Klebsormidium nitens]